MPRLYPRPIKPAPVAGGTVARSPGDYNVWPPIKAAFCIVRAGRVSGKLCLSGNEEREHSPAWFPLGSQLSGSLKGPGESAGGKGPIRVQHWHQGTVKSESFLWLVFADSRLILTWPRLASPCLYFSKIHSWQNSRISVFQSG